MLIKPGYIVLVDKYQKIVGEKQNSFGKVNLVEDIDEPLLAKIPSIYTEEPRENHFEEFEEEDTNEEYSNTHFRVGANVFYIKDIMRVLHPYN